MRIEGCRGILKDHLYAHAFPYDHFTVVWRADPHDTACQRGLANAGRPDQPYNFSAMNRKADIVKHLLARMLINRKAFGKPADGKQRVVCFLCCLFCFLLCYFLLLCIANASMIMRAAFAVGRVAKQLLRIGMLRITKNLFALPFLHDATVLHDHDAIRDLLRQSQIMRHEEHTTVLPRAALTQQCHDFLLCFDIQRRRRFIRNQKPRFGDHRQRDCGTLQHATAEFVRILPRTPSRLIKTQFRKQSHRLGLRAAPQLLLLFSAKARHFRLRDLSDSRQQRDLLSAARTAFDRRTVRFLT